MEALPARPPVKPGRRTIVGDPRAWPDIAVAALVGAGAFLAYLWSIAPSAFPGEPAELVVTAVGIRPPLTAQHAIWRLLVAAVTGLGEGNIVFRANFLSAVCGALSVGLLFLVMARTLTLLVDDETLGRMGPQQRHLAPRIARSAILLGSLAACLALAFAIPFWIAATQSYYHTFYVCWLLLSILCLLQYVRTDRLIWAVTFAFLHGAGMSQTAAFVTFAPLLGAVLVYALWRHERLYPTAILATIGGGVLGGSLVFVNAALFFDSEGFHLLRLGGYFQVVRLMLVSLTRGVLGGLPRVGWMILLGLTIAPWLASLAVSSRALNGERDWSFFVLHAVVAVVTVAVLIDIRASPWRFFGVSNVTIVPYLLTAMTFGYLATYLYLLPVHFWAAAERIRLQRLQRWLRVVIAAVVLLFGGVLAVLNHRQADHRGTRFLSLYADRMLDSLDGRTWLATNGFLDDLLLLRARERGIELHCLNLAEANALVPIRMAQNKMPNARMRNAAGLGFLALLQDWITTEPHASRDLALALVPDLWGLGDFEMLPNGLLFLGVPAEEMKAVDMEALVARHRTLWDELEQALEEVPDNAPDRLLFYRDRIVRPQVSFVGNNIGFLLEGMGRTNEAFAVYERVRALDPENVSALLNWANMVFAGHAPDRKDAVARDLEELNRRLDGAQLPIWSLSRVFGYVSRPEAFAQLGWSWANSGMPRLAIKALEQAATTTPEEQRVGLKSRMAHIHLLQDRPEESERIYFEMLVDDAGNREALMGLTRIFTLRGEPARAREFLVRAEKAGVPRTALLMATALVMQVEGNIPAARAILQEQVDLDPSNIDALMSLCALLMQERDAKALTVAVERLEETAGPAAFTTLLCRGGLALLLNDLRGARDYFLRAYRLQPASVALLDQVLQLDFQLADKASGDSHARALLRLDPAHGFANFIMGSLALERREFESAEAYLRRSIEAAPTVMNLNDLAMVLLRRGQIEEAEVRIQQAFKLDDQNYAAWSTYGLVQLAKGQLDEAEMAFNTALKHEAEDMRVHVSLADVLFRKNEVARAAEIIRAVAKQADTLHREDWELFEELHLKVLGVRFARPR